MALTINTNLEAMNAARNLNTTQNSLAAAMQHLSSGLRINSAGDDVAGYAIAQRLQARAAGGSAAARLAGGGSPPPRALRAPRA